MKRPGSPVPPTAFALPEHPPGAEACPHCGTIDRPLLTPGSGPHAVRASCQHCGHFLRWISLIAPAERLARKMQRRMAAMAQHPPSAAQLAYLKILGDTLAAPADMAEASARIEALKPKQQCPSVG
jgi:hypothetical protein